MGDYLATSQKKAFQYRKHFKEVKIPYLINVFVVKSLTNNIKINMYIFNQTDKMTKTRLLT